MARIRLDLDADTYMKLLDAALAERRPVSWQAEVMLRRALGLPSPQWGPAGQPCAGAAPHERPTAAPAASHG